MLRNGSGPKCLLIHWRIYPHLHASKPSLGGFSLLEPLISPIFDASAHSFVGPSQPATSCIKSRLYLTFSHARNGAVGEGGSTTTTTSTATKPLEKLQQLHLPRVDPSCTDVACTMYRAYQNVGETKVGSKSLVGFSGGALRDGSFFKQGARLSCPACWRTPADKLEF